jgi:hypothetical protein
MSDSDSILPIFWQRPGIPGENSRLLHGNIGNMNAVSFLISRKGYNPFKISAGLVLITLLGFGNFVAFLWLEKTFQTSLGDLSWILSLVSGLTMFALIAVLVGLVVGVPLYHLSQMAGTIVRFSENRILDELTSSGLTDKTIVDQVFGYYLKRTAILLLPSYILWAIVGLMLGKSELSIILLACFGFAVAILASTLLVACWKVAAGKKGRLLLLLPATMVFGPSLAILEVGGEGLPVILIAEAYVSLSGYFLALQGLRNRGRLKYLVSSFRRLTRLKQKGREFSDNAIVARQEALGREWGDLLTLSVSGLLLLMAMLLSAELESPWPVLNVLVVCGFVAAWRAAYKLSQSLTTELESSTLEILRSTPLGSKRFMEGWLDLTLKPLLGELACLSLPVSVFVLTRFPSALSDGSFVLCLLSTMAMPYLGALFGASIAGQLKSRSEVAAQLALVLLFCGLFTLPQVSMLMSLEEPVWIAVVLTGFTVWAAGWVLKAGATKSLDRVFLPRK